MGQIGKEWAGCGMKVRYVSPTGKAAIVAAEHLKAAGITAESTTIHSAFLRPLEAEGGRREITWDVRDAADRAPDPDVIVVDEASMLTTDVLQKAQAACPSSRFLFVGDHFQLPAVGKSAGVMLEPTWRLETIMRQAEGSPIVTFAHIVRTESIDAALTYARSLKGDHDSSDPLLFVDAILQVDATRRAIGWALGAGPDDGMVVTARNNTKTRLNRIARSIVRPDGSDQTMPQVGDLMVCELTAPLAGLVNGERFRVDTVKPAEVAGYVCLKDGTRTSVDALDETDKDRRAAYHDSIFKARALAYRARQAGVSPLRFPGAEAHADLSCSYGYALTCHKAQGSQAKRVLVPIGDMTWGTLEEKRRWLYTAVTRGSESVRLVRGM